MAGVEEDVAGVEVEEGVAGVEEDVAGVESGAIQAMGTNYM